LSAGGGRFDGLRDVGERFLPGFYRILYPAMLRRIRRAWLAAYGQTRA